MFYSRALARGFVLARGENALKSLVESDRALPVLYFAEAAKLRQLGLEQQIFGGPDRTGIDGRSEQDVILGERGFGKLAKVLLRGRGLAVDGEWADVLNSGEVDSCYQAIGGEK